MTDLKNQLTQLLGDEPAAPDDIERIVGAGRRARRRRRAVIATAGTLGAAGIGAAVAIPLAGNGDPDRDTIRFATPSSPTPSPSAATGNCYLMMGKAKGHNVIDRLLKEAGEVGTVTSIRKVPMAGGHRIVVEACTDGAQPEQPRAEVTEPPKGPPYNYDEKPAAIADRLESHLRDRVSGFGLSITYTRPFAQESSKLDDGKPSYFGGNVDVHEESGYADIGVQVIHETTEQVPFTGNCTAADKCEETTLADGSVLRTGQVKAGRGDIVLTAEVHRPDGVVVQAQESNYPFGPDAGTQPHGDQPLTLDQLVSLAKDSAFTF